MKIELISTPAQGGFSGWIDGEHAFTINDNAPDKLIAMFAMVVARIPGASLTRDGKMIAGNIGDMAEQSTQ